MSETGAFCLSCHCLCTPQSCRTGCALAVIDSLLRAQGTVRGDEVDLLLDLRWLIHHREAPEKALAIFCTLRRGMETRHYLACYRLRRWLENHLVAQVRIRPDAPERTANVKLDRYCLEAVRSRCVLAARVPGEPLLASRVRFAFRVAAPVQESADLLAISSP